MMMLKLGSENLENIKEAKYFLFCLLGVTDVDVYVHNIDTHSMSLGAVERLRGGRALF